MYQCVECGREFSTPFMATTSHGCVFGCPYCGNNYIDVTYQNDEMIGEFNTGGNDLKKYLEFVEDFVVDNGLTIELGETIEISGEDDVNYFIDVSDLSDYERSGDESIENEGLYCYDVQKELEGITYFVVTEEGAYE